MAYIYGLIIESISIPAKDSINIRVLQHELAMVGEYAKTNPGRFTKQFQAILTTYYEDIKSMPWASSCPKPNFLTRQLVMKDDDMTPEDNGRGSAQEVVATASANIVDGADEDSAAVPALKPAVVGHWWPPQLPPLPPAKRAGEVTASLRRSWCLLN